jgi:hypothetical protein
LAEETWPRTFGQGHLVGGSGAEKRAGTFGPDPFNPLDIATKADNLSASGLRLASTLPCRLGLLNRRFVIPRAAAHRFNHARRTLLDGRFWLVIAASTESCAAPGRELVDLGRSVIQTRIHLLISPHVDAFWFMLRRSTLEQLTPINHAAPDSFSTSYRFRYWPCTSPVQPDQEKAISCIKCRHIAVLLQPKQVSGD